MEVSAQAIKSLSPLSAELGKGLLNEGFLLTIGVMSTPKFPEKDEFSRHCFCGTPLRGL